MPSNFGDAFKGRLITNPPRNINMFNSKKKKRLFSFIIWKLLVRLLSCLRAPTHRILSTLGRVRKLGLLFFNSCKHYLVFLEKVNHWLLTQSSLSSNQRRKGKLNWLETRNDIPRKIRHRFIELWCSINIDDHSTREVELQPQ